MIFKFLKVHTAKIMIVFLIAWNILQCHFTWILLNKLPKKYIQEGKMPPAAHYNL